MTRTHFAAILLAALLAVCVLIGSSITKHADTAAELLRMGKAGAVAGDYNTAGDYCAQAEAYWKQHQLLLATILHHDEPDAIECGIAELIAYAQQEDADEFLALCDQLLTKLSHLKSMQIPTLQNIL